jgi:hypothetical protein
MALPFVSARYPIKERSEENHPFDDQEHLAGRSALKPAIKEGIACGVLPIACSNLEKEPPEESATRGHYGL